ncbi:hypothetical protein SDC9_144168 [bioreactor metagenome]|uniref:Uncharacterized protein n=1 Tax=bioreactor metagenome TaxID=1076179 RepID=A0A645E5G6_9ZZZZ
MANVKFLREVPLPPELTYLQIFEALQQTEDFFAYIRENAGINLSRFIQANNFSGVVSNVFTAKLSDVSPYKSYHDQRYPDLMHTALNIGLEVKASNKPMKGGEGHNGHTGWHVIVCYELLENGDIRFIHTEIADLIGFERGDFSDWKYQGSQRNINNSQRTETYITTNIGTSKLRDGSVYLDSDRVSISPGLFAARRRVEGLTIPGFSPFNG